MHKTAVIPLFLLVGCGYGQFQTARTTPAGEMRFTVAQLYLNNENIEERGGVEIANFPQQLDFRMGLSEQVDLGVKFLMFTGLLADTKVNLMPEDRDLALALHAGLGGAFIDPGRGERQTSVVHLPAGLIASYRFLNQLSPYLGAAYGFYWIFGRELDYRDPEKTYAEREGHGDGVLRLTAGLEWMTGERFGLLLEYDLLLPVIDDPGDNFAFVTNHLVGLGIRF